MVGGNISYDPISREAAMLLAKPPWWAYLIPEPEKPKPAPPKKPNKARKHMSHANSVVQDDPSFGRKPSGYIPGQDYTSDAGVRVVRVNGEELINIDDIRRLVIDEIGKLPKETRPLVLAAQDARKIISELVDGLGGQFEKFRADVKIYLEDIRQTRFAVVGETAQMTTSLKEVRQFFLGADYKDQIARLKEFVDLCERLKALKDSGFLDSVADTMLRLADKP